MSDCMCTYTGLQVNPMNIQDEDIRPEDIAPALSLLCRGGGHMKQLYTVGQHCLNCANEAKARGWNTRIIFACLLHDASEAYISDIIRPVKQHLKTYITIEETILRTIYQHYGLGVLSQEEQNQVKKIDNALLNYEMPRLMNLPYSLPEPELASTPDLTLKQPQETEKQYLEAVQKLQEELSEADKQN